MLASNLVECCPERFQMQAATPSIQLEGFPHLRRAKSGEYRFIFQFKDGLITVLVLKIGKRNDGEVYKDLENIDDE